MSDQQFLDDLARNPELELSKYLTKKLEDKYSRSDVNFTFSNSLMLFELLKENVKARDFIVNVFYFITALCFIAVAYKGAIS